jgi:hypothetical protein
MSNMLLFIEATGQQDKKLKTMIIPPNFVHSLKFSFRVSMLAAITVWLDFDMWVWIHLPSQWQK